MRGSFLIKLIAHLLVLTSGQDLYFDTSSSYTCRKDCINQNGNFCVTQDFSRGTCCDWELADADCGNHHGFCSNDILAANRFLGIEYWACPRENFCGDLI